jgi:hypothetical protein
LYSVTSIVGDDGAGGSGHQFGSVFESTDCRHAVGASYKATCCRNLGTHGPGGKVKAFKLARGDLLDWAGASGPEIGLDGSHVGQEKKHICMHIPGQKRCGQVFVHYRLDATQPPVGTSADRNATATCTDNDSPVRQQQLDGGLLGQPSWFRRSHDAPPISAVGSDLPPPKPRQPTALALVVDGSDELCGLPEGWIVRIHQRLRDEANHLVPWECIFKGLE